VVGYKERQKKKSRRLRDRCVKSPEVKDGEGTPKKSDKVNGKKKAKGREKINQPARSEKLGKEKLKGQRSVSKKGESRTEHETERSRKNLEETTKKQEKG